MEKGKTEPINERENKKPRLYAREWLLLLLTPAGWDVIKGKRKTSARRTRFTLDWAHFERTGKNKNNAALIIVLFFVSRDSLLYIFFFILYLKKDGRVDSWR